MVNLDKLTYAGNLDSLDEVMDDSLHTFVHGDIGDLPFVLDVLNRHKPAAIVNLAAESHVDRSIDAPDAFIQTNVVGTFRLLEAARVHWADLPADERAAFRFLHVSTDEVYGSLGATGAFTETTPYDPRSPYSASKAGSDHFVKAYHHTYGLPTLLTNCSNNYGPYQFPEKLIPLMILNAVEGKPLPVYGDGQNVRDWLFVEDHCAALSRVLESGKVGETYNIGGDCEWKNLDLVKEICRLVDQRCSDPRLSPRTDLIKFVPDRPGHDRRYAIDASKIRRELGWRPSHGFESGLTETVQWYLDSTAWVHRVTSGVYRRERLGLGLGAEREAQSAEG